MANLNPSPSTRFQSGHSANPSGRPRGRSVDGALRAILRGDFLEGIENPHGRPIGDLLAAQLVRQALDGDLRAAALVLDRAHGKPTQDLTHRVAVEDDSDDAVVEIHPDVIALHSQRMAEAGGLAAFDPPDDDRPRPTGVKFRFTSGDGGEHA